MLVAFGVIVAASLVLVFMRGDQLRSAGTVESIYSREGAFLLNNILFAVFAFVVLLGTVFPLVVEALQQRQIVVGEPFFDQLTVPIGITMLFIMAVAPVLPWRRSGRDSLGEKLLVPAIVGLVSLGLAVVVGANGLAPLLAFGLGGFAAGTVMLFAQTSAPTGWTKNTTTGDNSALRVTTGVAS
ncbi:MAG: hypothetical protein EBY98_02675, partial [Acidimicrobiia bacterium]|nr:hypothetical protein [Acidimicrobiia bacterium]